MGKKTWWREHKQSNPEGGSMSEKEVRLEEVKALEDHCDGHGVGTGNPEHTIRAFIQRRREAIEKLFAPKHEEAPAEEPAPADPEPPKEEPVQQ